MLLTKYIQYTHRTLENVGKYTKKSVLEKTGELHDEVLLFQKL